MDFPLTVSPSEANRYVPCSVATEHFTPAASTSAASALPAPANGNNRAKALR